jgi:hypothetical protein
MFGSLLATLEALVSPEIPPFAVAATIGNPNIVEIGVDCFHSIGALKIEDDVGIFQQHRLPSKNLILFTKQAAAAKIANNWLNPVFRFPSEGLVFRGEVNLCLDASHSVRRVICGQHVRESKP